MPGSLLVLKMLQTLVKIFITGASQTETHEGCRWTPFSLQIHVDHAFFEDTKVLFRSILQRCEEGVAGRNEREKCINQFRVTDVLNIFFYIMLT